MGTLVLIAYCSCHRGHSFQDSVQNENMGPLVKKLLKISIQQEQRFLPTAGSFECEVLCNCKGYMHNHPRPLATEWQEAH